MLVGLCNLCDDFGYLNFDELCEFIIEVLLKCFGFNVFILIKDVRKY